MKSEIAFLVVIAGLHLIVGAVHHYAHVAAGVENTPLELAFGLILHFGIDGPDLHSNVVPAHSAIFLYSALGLALVEFAGCVCGLRLCIRCRTSWR